MGSTASPQNTNNRDLDAILPSGGTAILKRAVAGSSRTPGGGGDTNLGAQEVGTDIDGATFAVGTATLAAPGFVVDDTTTATVAEGLIGVPRMGTDRTILTREMGPIGSRITHAIAVGTVATSLGTAISTGRLQLDLYNGGTVTVFLGGSAVGTATGMPIGTAMYFSETGPVAIYGITASGTASLRVMERS